MKLDKIRVACLLCAMVFSAQVVRAAGISSFEQLDRAITNGDSLNIQSGSDIKFNKNLEITREVFLDGAGNTFTQGQIQNSVEGEEPPTFSDYTGSAFTVVAADEEKGISAGNLTIQNVTFDRFTITGSLQDLIENNGTLTIGPATTISNAKFSGRMGAAINNKGTLTITSSSDGNVVFEKNMTNLDQGSDLYLNDKSITTINGSANSKVIFGSGIRGVSGAQIFHETNILELNGDNSQYEGRFTNNSGTVIVNSGAKFFHGISEFEQGTLQWNTDKNGLGSSAKLKMDADSTLIVGDGQEAAALTVNRQNNDSYVNSNIITIKENATLEFANGKTTAISPFIVKTINGEGNLVFTNTNVTFNTSSILSEDITLQTSASKVTLVGLTDSGSDVNSIISAVVNAENNEKMDLVLDGVTTAENFVINGSDILSLTTENTVTIGNLTVGVDDGTKTVTVTNKNTLNAGDVTVYKNSTISGESSGKTGTLSFNSLANAGTVKAESLTVETTINNSEGTSIIDLAGELNASGTITNSGTISAVGGTIADLTNSGRFANTANSFGAGNITNEGTISLAGGEIASLNNSKTFISSNGITVTNDLTNKGDDASISITNTLVAGAIDNGATIEAGTLTVSTGDLENSGTVTVKNNGALSVTTGSVKNEGTITAGALTVGAGLENSKSITVTSANITGALTNTDGKISTGTLSVGGKLTNSATIEAGALTVGAGLENSSSITVTSANITGTLKNTAGTISTKGGALTVSDAVTNSAEILAGKFTAKNGVTNNDKATLTIAGGEIAQLTNDGTLSNSGTETLTLSGDVDGSGEISNTGTIKVTGNASDFDGSFIQTGGSTTATDVNSKIFGGTKTISNSSLTIAGANIYYDSVSLGEKGVLNHTSNGADVSNITSSVLEFTSEGASATFNKGSYNLSSGVGKSGNTIEFSGDARLTLTANAEGSYKFAGTTKLTDSTLDLHTSDLVTEGEEYGYNTFNYDELIISGNSSVDFDVRVAKGVGNGNNYIETDIINAAKGSGTLNLGKIYVDLFGNETGQGEYKTKDNVIQGSNSIKLSAGSSKKATPEEMIDSKVSAADNAFEYDIVVTDDGKSIYLDNICAADAHSLNKMNIQPEWRQFTTNGEYHIGLEENGYGLDDMASGVFKVFGKNKDNTKDIISGAIGTRTEDGTYKATEGAGNGSLFNITSGTTVDFTIEDLTITEAHHATRGGSVLHNESATSRIDIVNSLITNNSSGSTTGGAIYNNGGTGVNPKSETETFTGLYLENTTFTANSSAGLGGAIYNDTNGYIYLNTVTTSEGTDEAKNDIYNAGKGQAWGSKFNSLFTNANGGVFEFNGSNTLAELDNAGTIKTGEKSNETTIAKMTNSGTANFNGYENKITESLTNSGTANFGGVKDTIESLTNTGTVNISSTQATLKDVDGTDAQASITNSSGNLTLTGDASKYLGTFTQDTAGYTTVQNGATFFGGESTITEGMLSWQTTKDMVEGAILKVTGNAGLWVGDEKTGVKAVLSLNENSVVDADVYIATAATVNVNKGGSLTLTESEEHNFTRWNGTINLKDGDLVLNNLGEMGSGSYSINNGVLNATGGNLDINNSVLELGKSSVIAAGALTSIDENSTIIMINSSSVSLDSDDEWSGNIYMKGGTLTADGVENGFIYAEGGKLNVVSSAEEVQTVLEIGGTKNLFGQTLSSSIAKDVELYIDEKSTVDITDKGYVHIGDNDKWEGTIVLNEGGTLDYAKKKDNGTLTAIDGNLNLLDGSVLHIVEPSTVAEDVAVDIQKGATVVVDEGSVFNIDAETGDKWNGLVHNNGGIFHTKGIVNKGDGGSLYQVAPGESIFDEESEIVISGDKTKIEGGSIRVRNNSSLRFAKGDYLILDELEVSQNSTFGIMNGAEQVVAAGKIIADGKANYELDLNLRNWMRVKDGDTINNRDLFIATNGDKFIAREITGGNIHVSDFDFVGGAPITRHVFMQLFDAETIGENVTFTATDKQIMTPIGEYGITPIGNTGAYMANLGRYNPKVFRGQVSTLAMYNNQLSINDLMFNHIMLQSEKSLFGQGRTSMANRYASVNPLFAPYQQTREEGGLWYKAYADIETLSLTRGFNVHNTAYGSLIGADLPIVKLKKGWEFLPTAYIAYNGSRQSYSNMNMYQNGGQGGFMGTFMKDDFIGSVVAYGGGYLNEMKVEGFNDEAGNWFVGTAAKAAYNFHPTKHFTLQPSAMVSYNLFGKQSWGTDFGVMGMNSGMLNGINIAPGLNLIYARDTWSLYTTFQYMFNINDHVGGHAGVDVELPSLSMRHGYFQYGIGATKTWKDRLNSYLQFVIRNGGRTGVGFQLGLQYLFDWSKFGKKSKKSTKVAPTTSKEVIKSSK